jgi:hypothetical protein
MQDIAHWLKTLGLPEYARPFAENGMDLDFPNLDDQDLQRRGSRQRCIRLSSSTTERRPPRCRLVLRGWPSASRANGSSRPSVDYRYRIFPFCQSLFIIFDMSDEIANNLYLVGILIRDLHTGKFIFHQYHQLQTTEPSMPKSSQKCASSITRLASIPRYSPIRVRILSASLLSCFKPG